MVIPITIREKDCYLVFSMPSWNTLESPLLIVSLCGWHWEKGRISSGAKRFTTFQSDRKRKSTFWNIRKMKLIKYYTFLLEILLQERDPAYWRAKRHYADYESWRVVFRTRVWSGLCAWPHSYTVGRSAFRHKNSWADGGAYHVCSHHCYSAVDSTASRRAVHTVYPTWYGLRRAWPSAGRGIYACAVASGPIDKRLSCKPRPRVGNGLLHDAWSVCHHATSRCSEMRPSIRYSFPTASLVIGFCLYASSLFIPVKIYLYVLLDLNIYSRRRLSPSCMWHPTQPL